MVLVMRICVIDGYHKDGRQQIDIHNIELAHQCFHRVLQEYSEVTIDVYFAWEKLPENFEYDGFVFTGSDWHPKELVDKEKELFLKIIDKDIPVYGSCWGAQLAAISTGGIVKLLNNREQPIAENIHIVNDHFIYKDKPKIFTGFASHAAYISYPGECDVLAVNKYTGIQALSIGSFVGFQYHCEYRTQEAAGFLQIRKPETVSHNIEDYDFDKTIKDKQIRQTEIKNWLDSLEDKK
jgi:GMP synthase (glutamine-hydrolysing)